MDISDEEGDELPIQPAAAPPSGASAAESAAKRPRLQEENPIPPGVTKENVIAAVIKLARDFLAPETITKVTNQLMQKASVCPHSALAHALLHANATDLRNCTRRR